MASWLTTLCLFLTIGALPPDTKFVQVAPAAPPLQEARIARSVGQGRAVILIEGLSLHLLRPKQAVKAELRPWQQPGSVLVRTVAKEADVFAFTYGQTAPVTDIADLPALSENIQRLRQAGYSEVVLVGFSAGGLVARQFVEDQPGAGVTKVIQVCTPNVGTVLAKVKAAAIQEPFLQSLTRRSRSRALDDRREKRIPAGVAFVCVVGTGLVFGDGIVSTRSQWPEDLQVQGVPAVPLDTEHWEAMRAARGAQLIARLVRENQPRWDAAQVANMRKQLWREKSGSR